MSDVLPEWGIKLRNIVDRIAPLINEHHRDLHDFRARVGRLEAQVAQQQQIIAQMQSTMGAIQAVQMGNGPTTTDGR